MTKLIVVFFAGVAFAASHAAARRRTQEVAAKANAIIDDARPAASIMLDPSSDTQTVIGTCRDADRWMFKLLALDYGDWGAEPHGRIGVVADLADIRVLEEGQIPFTCGHVPFDEFWQVECARACRLEWSWLSDELGRIRVRAGEDGVLMVAL